MNKKEIIDTLNNIYEDVFCDYCEYCKLDGDCECSIEEKTCNKFKQVIQEIEERLEE
jgi:hypothetical protein